MCWIFQNHSSWSWQPVAWSNLELLTDIEILSNGLCNGSSWTLWKITLVDVELLPRCVILWAESSRRRPSSGSVYIPLLSERGTHFNICTSSPWSASNLSISSIHPFLSPFSLLCLALPMHFVFSLLFSTFSPNPFSSLYLLQWMEVW